MQLIGFFVLDLSTRLHMVPIDSSLTVTASRAINTLPPPHSLFFYLSFYLSFFLSIFLSLSLSCLFPSRRSRCDRDNRRYPDKEYLDATRPGFSSVLPKVVGQTQAPGDGSVGGLRPGAELAAAGLDGFGCLPPGIPVSASVIDAHAGVPGAGVGAAGSMVLVLGTSACYMVNGTAERMVPGVAGVVQDGILPGLVGYENRKTLPTENLLEDTDGLRRGTKQPISVLSGAVADCDRFLLTSASLGDVIAF